jgi:hypothetical protein
MSSRLTIGIATHHANPTWLTFQDQKDGDVDDARSKSCAAANKCPESNCSEGSIDVVAVGVKF